MAESHWAQISVAPGNDQGRIAPVTGPPSAQLRIAPGDPGEADVAALLAAHLGVDTAETPAEHRHTLDLDGLRAPGITLYCGRLPAGELAVVGALKELDPRHGELKSMHTAAALRGRGLGRVMLEHLLAEARSRGYARVSLETGTMDVFAPARALYASAGFVECPPFGEYRPSPYNFFMTLALAPRRNH